MAQTSRRGEAAGFGGVADQPALHTTLSTAAVGFGANNPKSDSDRPARRVAVRVCRTRSGVVAAVAVRQFGPAQGIASASRFTGTGDVYAVAPGAWRIRDRPASTAPRGGQGRSR